MHIIENDRTGDAAGPQVASRDGEALDLGTADIPPPGARRRPKNDPARRERIIEAAARVISERGIDALTFRAVAQMARVPLSSTTYYFADKDDLLRSTVRTFRQSSTGAFEQELASAIHGTDLAGGLAALIEEFTVRQHARLMAEYGLYLCTLHRASLREEISGWRMEELIRPYVDLDTARLLAFAAEGIMLQSVMEGIMFFAAEVEPMFRRIVNSVP